MKSHSLRKHSAKGAAFLSFALLTACSGAAPEPGSPSPDFIPSQEAHGESAGIIASADDKPSTDILPPALKDISDVSGLVANVFGAGQAASFVLNLFFQIAGIVGNDQQQWKEEFAELNSHLDNIAGALDWKVSETDRENAFEDMLADVSHAQETLSLGQPFTIGSDAMLNSRQKVNEAEKPIGFQRLFVESVTGTAERDSWKWVLPDSQRPSTANGEVDSHGDVYDWRSAIAHLLMMNALRIQMIAAADPNFLTDGVFTQELTDHRNVLLQHLQTMKNGVRCDVRGDYHCDSADDPNTTCIDTYSSACADVFTGVNALGFDENLESDPSVEPHVRADIDGLRRQVLVQLPLFEVQAMIDTLALYASGLHDLTIEQSQIALDANRSLCLSVPGRMGDVFDWRLKLATCNASDGQKWKYDRATQTIVNTVFNKCLEVALGDITPGTLVSAASCNGSDAQKWTYDPLGQVITSKLGNVLDVEWGQFQPGQPVWTWTRSDVSAQRWYAAQKPIFHIPHF